MARNYVAEIKERGPGEPCFLWINTNDDIGLGREAVLIHLPEGSDYSDAEELRDVLHRLGAKITLSK